MSSLLNSSLNNKALRCHQSSPRALLQEPQLQGAAPDGAFLFLPLNFSQYEYSGRKAHYSKCD